MNALGPAPRRPGRSLVEWQLDRFLRKPPSIRTAASVIVSATTLVVVASAVLMRAVDPKDFKNIWEALWWAVQTATTVGYGDIVPHHTGGYIVGVFVMLEGIAFLTIITAVITSMFVARAQKALGISRDEHWAGLLTRLDRIEEALGIAPPPSESPSSHDAPPNAPELDDGATRLRRDP